MVLVCPSLPYRPKSSGMNNGMITYLIAASSVLLASDIESVESKMGRNMNFQCQDRVGFTHKLPQKPKQEKYNGHDVSPNIWGSAWQPHLEFFGLA